MKTIALRHALLVALFLPSVVHALAANQATPEDEQAMERNKEEYGHPNPNAPRELSQFAFLIGKWRCEAKIKGENGSWQLFKATWVARYILDGYVIADEYRMMDSTGKLVMLGQNYRSYNTDKKAWVMKWQEALTSTWLDLGPDELGGVRVNDTSITYKAQFRPNEIHRMNYLNISADHFTWRGEASRDGGETWAGIMVIEAYRRKE